MRYHWRTRVTRRLSSLAGSPGGTVRIHHRRLSAAHIPGRSLARASSTRRPSSPLDPFPRLSLASYCGFKSKCQDVRIHNLSLERIIDVSVGNRCQCFSSHIRMFHVFLFFFFFLFFLPPLLGIVPLSGICHWLFIHVVFFFSFLLPPLSILVGIKSVPPAFLRGVVSHRHWVTVWSLSLRLTRRPSG